MELCLEEYDGEFICINKVIPGEELCKEHNDEQQTVDSEGYIKDEKLYNKYISNLLYYDNLYLVNIEKIIIKEYLFETSLEYVNDIIIIEEEISKIKYNSIFISIYKSVELVKELFKPNINTISFNGKVDYLDHKVEVYKFPINDKNKYSHLYNNSIIYYKHICNNDLYRKTIEPYVAYMCCI